ALVVRFITHRYIGEYTNLEKYTYNHIKTVDNDNVRFEVLDTAGNHCNDLEKMGLRSHIKWADGFVLMYSISDLCSFNECSRLKFLINYSKRRKKSKVRLFLKI
uniref:small monomeric GTPase n=1 Tax=Megaselia scalaris TaxID=36166 RepID=T1GIW0_MEGSC